MSDPNDRAPEGVQAAFDHLAPGLGLRLEPSVAEILTIGEGFPDYTKAMDVEIMQDPPPVGAEDDDAIRTLLGQALSLTPQQLDDSWRNYYHDPFVAIGTSWVATIDEKVIKRWLDSDELGQLQSQFPPFDPRRVTVRNIKIVYIGRVRAAATYHVEEHYTNGKVAAGNSMAVLVKLEGGDWRILAMTKEERMEVLPGGGA